MKKFVALLAVGMMVGCESAVLVNNRPEREQDWNATTPSQPRTASADASANMDVEGAQTAATTQPADQTVETRDTRIESHSN
jgi:hypothetical protein